MVAQHEIISYTITAKIQFSNKKCIMDVLNATQDFTLICRDVATRSVSNMSAFWIR